MCLPPLRFALLFLASFILLCEPIAGQSDTGKVVVTITDVNGALVPGATVTARNLTGLMTREAASSHAGEYEIPTVAVGRYEITVVAAGFKTVRQTISVHVNEESRVALVLEAGEPSATVTVSSEAGQVQLTTSNLGKVVGGELIVNLPLNGRNLLQIIPLQKLNFNANWMIRGLLLVEIIRPNGPGERILPVRVISWIAFFLRIEDPRIH